MVANLESFLPIFQSGVKSIHEVSRCGRGNDRRALRRSLCAAEWIPRRLLRFPRWLFRFAHGLFRCAPRILSPSGRNPQRPGISQRILCTSSRITARRSQDSGTHEIRPALAVESNSRNAPRYNRAAYVLRDFHAPRAVSLFLRWQSLPPRTPLLSSQSCCRCEQLLALLVSGIPIRLRISIRLATYFQRLG